MMPYCVNSATGQWYGLNMKPIPTPPTHVSTPTRPISATSDHISLNLRICIYQALIKAQPPILPTDINEYHIPAIDLPDQWKYAINNKGQIYYYHTKILIPQWDPPIKLLPLMEEQRLPDFDFRMDSSERTVVADDSDEDEVRSHYVRLFRAL